MKFCLGTSGKKHAYDETKYLSCPQCFSTTLDNIPARVFAAELLNTVEQIATETFSSIEEKNPEHPPLCTNCHWIATNYDRDSMKYRCLNPENYAGINVVDGSKVYIFEFCWQLRSTDNKHPQACCDYLGKGFKQRVQAPISHVSIADIESTSSDKLPTKLTSVKTRKLTDTELNEL